MVICRFSKEDKKVDKLNIKSKLAKIVKNPNDAPFSEELSMAKEGALEVFYSPFDYINANAKLVIVGISPGETQAKNANQEFANLYNNNLTEVDALKGAKEVASFSGAMRNNLVKLLDNVGVNSLFNLSSCMALFNEEAAHMVHYTSVFRYPVLKNGKPISSAKGYLKSPLLNHMVKSMLTSELEKLNNAIILPLGQGVNDVLMDLVECGVIHHSAVLSALPHPSGANAERIKYFLGEKARADLSVKTNALFLDKARENLLSQIDTLKGV
ncbi:MAG: hypothetical protein COA47_14715 [Robiginitomaculum sp.]|nr:MAG: hypothetical protein COA47_14715 [Robiginitomaculum sp.]